MKYSIPINYQDVFKQTGVRSGTVGSFMSLPINVKRLAQSKMPKLLSESGE